MFARFVMAIFKLFNMRKITDAQVIARARDRDDVNTEDIAFGLWMRFGPIRADREDDVRATDVALVYRELATQALRLNDLKDDRQHLDLVIRTWHAISATPESRIIHRENSTHLFGGMQRRGSNRFSH